MSVKFAKLHPDAFIPTKGTPYSAGFDLYCVESVDVAHADGNVIIKTGIAVQLPEGTYGRIAARSGISVKDHFAVSAGVIDLDYEGKPLGVVGFVTKPGHTAHINRGDRIAQLIIERVEYCPAETVDEIVPRYENHDGFGSTGK